LPLKKLATQMMVGLFESVMTRTWGGAAPVLECSSGGRAL
jgi:hypothetical protein